MDSINKDGFITSDKVYKKLTQKGDPFPIAYGSRRVINGIVVHQTATETAGQVFNSYIGNHANGAHFLIDLNGKIYQTASLYKIARHVGEIRARCLLRSTCSKVEIDAGLEEWNKKPDIKKSHNHEKMKAFPDRFPKNEDSIGIELVGMAWKSDPQRKKRLEDQSAKEKNWDHYIFDPLTKEQLASLEWLIRYLSEKFKVPFSEVYRHPEISFKKSREAISAKELIEKLKAEEVEVKAKEEAEAKQ